MKASQTPNGFDHLIRATEEAEKKSRKEVLLQIKGTKNNKNTKTKKTEKLLKRHSTNIN